jgi:hypothetical protein
MLEIMPDESLLVSVAELRRSVDVLLSHVEATAGDTIALNWDYFWSVPPGTLYDVAGEPSELTVGQLSESLQHLRELVQDEDRALSYHLVWLADVLRALGHHLPT